MRGLFDRFRRDASASEGDNQVNLDDLQVWIDERENVTLRRIYPQLKNLVDSTEEVFSEIRQIGRTFLEAEISSGVAGRSGISLQKSKDTLGRRMLELSQRFEQISINSFSEIKTLQTNILESLTILADLGRAYARPLVVQFNEELRMYRKQARELGRISLSLRGITDSNQEQFQNFSKAKDVVRKILELRSDVKNSLLKINEIEVKIPEAEKEKLMVDKQITELKTSAEYGKFESEMDAFQIVNKELSDTKAAFEQDFSSLIKPLRKMVHVASLDKVEAKVVNAFLADPWSAMLESDDQLIANMLRKIATLLKSGRVDVKRREKIIHKVEMLLGDSHTRSKSYRDIQRKVDEKRNVMNPHSSVLQRLTELQDVLSSKMIRIEELSSMIESEKKLEMNLKTMLETQIQEIDGELSNLGFDGIHVIR